jgi:hypothetical protein
MAKRVTRTWRVVTAISAALIAVGLTMAVSFHRESRPVLDVQAVYGAIGMGDRLEEAESALGMPPGDYRNDRSVVYYGLYNNVRGRHPTWREISWQFDSCEVIVLLDEDQHIASKEIRSGVPGPGRWARTKEQVTRWFR